LTIRDRFPHNLKPVGVRRGTIGVQASALSNAILVYRAGVDLFSARESGESVARRVRRYLSADCLRAALPWRAGVRDSRVLPLCTDVRAVSDRKGTERAGRLAPSVRFSRFSFRWVYRRPGGSFHFDLNLFDMQSPAVAYLVLTFAQLARDGLGPRRGRADLAEVRQLPASAQ